MQLLQLLMEPVLSDLAYFNINKWNIFCSSAEDSHENHSGINVFNAVILNR